MGGLRMRSHLVPALFLLVACGQPDDPLAKPADDALRVKVAVRDPKALDFRSVDGGPPTIVFPGAGEAELHSEVGHKENGRLMSTGRPGFLQFGPYITLPAGSYRVSWIGHIERAKARPAATVDVVSDMGRLVIVAPVAVEKMARTASDILATADFTLEHQQTQVEFRLVVANGTVLSLDRVQLIKKTK